MTDTVLPLSFFERDTLTVARELLGSYLYHRTVEGILYRGIICEIETYHGEEDLACHCSRGITQRTRVMYGDAGHIYIYLIYGMYHMLNFVCMPRDFPAAVLIRGIAFPEWDTGEGFRPVHVDTGGPGKLTRWMQINREHNGNPANKQSGIWVTEGLQIPRSQIITGKRIGVDYAGEWKDKPWNFSCTGQVLETIVRQSGM